MDDGQGSSNEPIWDESRGAARWLIRASGLGVRRSGRWLVRGVDLAVRGGEVLALIGPNGSGKTTTIKALLGIEALSAGHVDREPGLRIGYVPQKLAIDRTLPLKVRHLLTLTHKASKSTLQAALAETGVEHLLNATVQHLSGGEFQRVLLARALIRRPDLLVLDEPVQGVDFNGEVALYQLISAIRARLGCGVLLVSHDLHVVMAETDQVICLNTHVCCRGAPNLVADSPEFRSLFGARAAESLAVYRHRHDHEHRIDGSVTGASRLDSQELANVG